VLDGLVFPAYRNNVELYKCDELPKPFWSRASKPITATINLPRNPANAESARLIVRIWDGGEGTITEHFKINGYPYSITSGRANNTLVLLSDTEHHGIEVLLPGPCLLLRYGKSVRLPFD